MKTVSTRVGLDATVLKLIGVVTMTIDHIGVHPLSKAGSPAHYRPAGLPHFRLPDRGGLYLFQTQDEILPLRAGHRPAVLCGQLLGGTQFVPVHHDHLRLFHRPDLPAGTSQDPAKTCLLEWRFCPGADRLLFALPAPADSRFYDRLWFFGHHHAFTGLVGQRETREDPETDRGIVPDRLRDGRGTGILLGGRSPVGAVQWKTRKIPVEGFFLPLLSHPFGYDIWDRPVDVKKKTARNGSGQFFDRKKIAGSPASRAFCAAKSRRRQNLLLPSK